MNFPENEKKILKHWDQHDIFKKTLEKPAPQGSFVFYEGPPTANGKPGIHHAEARAFKDCIPRYKTMRGYKVIRKAGWDTHGLPVELEVEKQLGFTGKAQIEEYGIDKFNAKCKESVWAYKENWEVFTKRLGYWVDLEDPYVTYHSDYIESLWWVVKQVWEKGLLYKDYRVTPHCPRCGTSLSSHELSQGYKDVKDLSVTAKFHLVDEPGTYLLAWTTTPWTLPGNVGLAVGKDLDYVKVKQGEEFLWLAKERLSEVIEGDVEIIEEVKGEVLVGKAYEPLYPFMREAMKDTDQEDKKAWFIMPADFVTTSDGTGIVHTAVMYGADDFALGNEAGLPKHHLVNLDGTFVEGTDFLTGRFVADEDVAVDIIKDLAHRGLLFAKAKYEHSYPHCWRCKTKVIYYAKDSWYIRMSELRDELLKQNTTIHWEPSHIQDGRFGEWLREVKDWAFSRERYWGTPLPIWEAEDGDQICIGSFEELKTLAKDPSQVGESFDPHRPYVDDIILVKDGKEYKRVPDVCDVWFDSGCMPYAQWHYPFENKVLVDSGEAYPADYISEAIDQTRGWFYTLLAVSTLLGRPSAYKNVICLGHVLDVEGKKMSKSLGNIVEPMEMMETYGADAIRWYMYTINQPGESKRFDEKMLSDMVKKNFGILMNVASFYEMFAGDIKRNTEVSTQVLDRWILARLNKLVQETTERLDEYVITETVRELGEFITDLSTWYVRRSRDRVKGENEQDKSDTITTLYECLHVFSRLTAPFAPFLAETLYQRVGGEKPSVHLEHWPEANQALIDDEVLTKMHEARMIVSRVLERRVESGVPVKQVLSSVTITLPSGEFAEAYRSLVADEVNVKEVKIQKGEMKAELDLTLTPELVREGMIREIIRKVNALRKQAGLTINNRIELYVTGSEEVLQAIKEHEDVLLHSTLASTLRTSGDVPGHKESFTVNLFDITVGFVTIKQKTS
jgi:isoleucyl-tRNA synthetase